MARRFMGRVLAYGDPRLKEVIQELSNIEEKYRYGYKRRTRSITTEASKVVNQYKQILRGEDNYLALKADYWSVTNAIITDKSTGKLRRDGEIEDWEIANKVTEKAKLRRKCEI